MDTGRIIKDLRKAKGLTQQELAVLSGITQGTLSQIESGTYTARPGSLERISKALATSVAVILISALERRDFGNITEEVYAKVHPQVKELLSLMV